MHLTATSASIVACAALLSTACASRQEAREDWQSVGLPRSVLILQSDSKVEELRFVDERWAVVTTGTKGGPLTGPIFPWSHAGIELKIGKDAEYELLEFIAKSETRVRARRRSGEIVEYKFLKP